MADVEQRCFYYSCVHTVNFVFLFQSLGVARGEQCRCD